MSGDKTEQPTERKLEDSRREGQVAERKNVNEIFTLLVGTLFIFGTTHFFMKGFVDIFALALEELDKGLYEKRHDIQGKFFAAFSTSLILTGVLGLLCLIGHLLLNGFNFAPRSLSPKFDKLNPVNGLKNMFSKTTAYNFVRLVTYFGATTMISYVVIKENFADVISASVCGVGCVADVFNYLFKLTIILILLVLIILAAFDFKIQTAIYIGKSKMTQEEVKREHKSSEGDPLVKSRRRRLALEDANVLSVRDITHVVYSSGYLVGVVYHKGKRPFVVLRIKGEDVTRQVSKLRSAGIKCVNMPDVAREFFIMGQKGRYLPSRSLKGMSKILA